MEVKIVYPSLELHLVCVECGQDLEVVREDRELIIRSNTFNKIIHVLKHKCE